MRSPSPAAEVGSMVIDDVQPPVHATWWKAPLVASLPGLPALVWEYMTFRADGYTSGIETAIVIAMVLLAYPGSSPTAVPCAACAWLPRARHSAWQCSPCFTPSCSGRPWPPDEPPGRLLPMRQHSHHVGPHPHEQGLRRVRLVESTPDELDAHPGAPQDGDQHGLFDLLQQVRTVAGLLIDVGRDEQTPRSGSTAASAAADGTFH